MAQHGGLIGGLIAGGKLAQGEGESCRVRRILKNGLVSRHGAGVSVKEIGSGI